MKHGLSILLICSLFFTLQGRAYSAEDLTVARKKGLIVAKSAAYGLGGGIVVGLASQAFYKDMKNVFLAGSLGMYAGLILGVIIISSGPSHAPHYDGPDTYNDEDFTLAPLPSTQAEKIKSIGRQNEDSGIRFSFLSANF